MLPQSCKHLHMGISKQTAPANLVVCEHAESVQRHLWRQARAGGVCGAAGKRSRQQHERLSRSVLVLASSRRWSGRYPRQNQASQHDHACQRRVPAAPTCARNHARHKGAVPETIVQCGLMRPVGALAARRARTRQQTVGNCSHAQRSSSCRCNCGRSSTAPLLPHSRGRSSTAPLLPHSPD